MQTVYYSITTKVHTFFLDIDENLIPLPTILMYIYDTYNITLSSKTETRKHFKINFSVYIQLCKNNSNSQ